MLEGLVPRLVPGHIQIRYMVFEGKSDLEKRMGPRLSGWCNPEACFIVVRDQDSGDCRTVKSALAAICRKAGRPDAVVRVACRELESWYLADLEAVECALGFTGLAHFGRTAKYREPDGVAKPSTELKRIHPAYQKIRDSRLIGPHLDPDNTKSPSFACLVAAIRRCGLHAL